MGLFRRATPTTPADLAEVRAEMASLREALEQHGSSTFQLEGRLRAMDTRVVEPDAGFADLATRVADLDARVTAVATELANQLTELGHDLDALGAGPAAANGHDPAVLGEIRDGQIRLANEQARYQMAFREDLARLVGELKRPR